MTISNPPEGAATDRPGQVRLAALLPDPHGSEPRFREPWQAQAFALTVRLYETGAFTWAEWTAELAARIEAAGADDGSRYYEHWLAALEALVVSRGLADRAALDERKEVWAEAYRSTPHGQAVELPCPSRTQKSPPDPDGLRRQHVPAVPPERSVDHAGGDASLSRPLGWEIDERPSAPVQGHGRFRELADQKAASPRTK